MTKKLIYIALLDCPDGYVCNLENIFDPTGPAGGCLRT